MKMLKETVYESRIYRQPKKITEAISYRDGSVFAVCPSCKKVIDREFQLYCSCCGQKLKWTVFENASVIYV